MSSESVTFGNGQIEVSRSLVRVGQATIAIASIGGLEVLPPDRAGFIGTAVMAAIVTGGLFSFGADWWVVVIALIVAAGAAAMGYSLQEKLVLRMTSGQPVVLASGTSEQLAELRSAIEFAIAEYRRG